MAGKFEVWAARLWNVFNEGRPFSLVYPALVLLVLRPSVPALLGALAFAAILVPFSFPLRGRALLWLAAAASIPLLEPWRAPGLLAAALAGYFAFTVLLWGSVYYHLRTGAPWTNFLRFWRLVLTNSDPTSGNALEQIPKFLMALSAGELVASRWSLGTLAQVAASAVLTAVLGAIAWKRFRRRLPAYPAPAAPPLPPAPPGRFSVIVIDGANKNRLRQAQTPVIDRLATEGSEYLNVDPAYPARTVVCFSSMLTGATPREHGMRSNFAPRLGVRRQSVFDVLDRHGRRGRLVGIAHLLDPFPHHTRPVTSVQPTEQLDDSLRSEAERVVDEEDPDLLVLQLLAADQIGHVRGTRSREYIERLEDSDRQVGTFLDFLHGRGKLDGATVILLADHGQGRGIGGHGHLDWGERPVPFVVWGQGAVPGGVVRKPCSILELAGTVSALLGVEAPEAARGRPLLPAVDPGVEPAEIGGRCLAIVVARDEERTARWGVGRLPGQACGLPLDVLVVDDGSRDRTAALAREFGARVLSHDSSRGLGAALRSGLAVARDDGYAAAVYLDGDGEYDPAQLERLLGPVARGRANYVLGSRFLGRRDGMSWQRALANRLASAALGTLMETVLSDGQTGFRAFSARALASARIAHDYNYAQVLTLSLWGEGIDALEVPIDYRRRTGGRSFVRYPEYLARVVPAVWREWRKARASRATRTAAATPTAPARALGQSEPSKNGNASVSGPNGASGRSVTSVPPPQRTST